MTLYESISLFISCLAALGTIAATIVALYLSNRQDKVDLKASVYKAVMVGGLQPWPECVAISIVNRSKFPIQVDLIGWSLPKSSMKRCYMLDPDYLYSNGIKGARIPFFIEPGSKSPLFTIPWEDFEKTLNFMANHDNDGVFSHEVVRKRICFYVSTPRTDRNINFKISNEIMDAFVRCLAKNN